ncbi:PREDICTED: GDP-fucose protein O-fucosyltransferase 2 [Papilio xuthus]|uniref:GDP-fucose protein O-fucosyltransferase 2 n=1 Tax=Papilio xuthus TaxID=66420 RepID=A0AAJ7EEN6_PAPXU|nr:PREDICTED: GDP-fucose protein O-fucosyltransferase 2 [Papilio xuthus]
MIIYNKFILVILHFLIITQLFAAAKDDNGFCDASAKHCKPGSGEKFLMYDVNPPEGFNLRRDVYMRFAIMLAETQKMGKKINWRLVLPPWHRLYHWKSGAQNKPLPWNKFFDVNSLKTYVPVIELQEVVSNSITPLKIDRLYVLQNYENAFEDGVFHDKWTITDDCKYDGLFWGYNNITVKETVCVNFQGKISKLWELIALHPKDKYVMFSHGEIPLHTSYGTKTYWDCRKSMKFNTGLVKTAKNFILQFLNCKIEKCTTYLSVHWRRRDFAYSRGKDVPSLQGTAKQIDQIAKDSVPDIKTIFIATDASETEVRTLENDLKELGYKVNFFIPSKKELEMYKDGGIAIIDQIICSHAAFFVGTHDSTFTFRIQEEREILGFPSSTTFNRLCPDTGKCEKPSKWTIVN